MSNRENTSLYIVAKTRKFRWLRPPGSAIKKYIAEPGEKASFLYGTAYDKIKVLYEIEHHGAIIKTEWLDMQQTMKQFEIPVLEEYRGNFAYHLTFIKNNRIYRQDQLVSVSHSDKVLDIQFESFRDKLLPGQQEEWKLILKGPKGDKAMAEMVATMYDASLDAFRTNSWYFNILNYSWLSLSWTDNYAFTTATSETYRKIITDPPQSVNRYYDYLNWFGYSFYGNNQYYTYKGMPGRFSSVQNATGMVSEITMDGFAESAPPAPAADKSIDGDQKIVNLPVEAKPKEQSGEQGKDQGGAVQVRSNFNETAFFFPHLVNKRER